MNQAVIKSFYNCAIEHRFSGYEAKNYRELTKEQREKVEKSYVEASIDLSEALWGGNVFESDMFEFMYYRMVENGLDMDELKVSDEEPCGMKVTLETIRERAIHNFDPEFKVLFERSSIEEQDKFFEEYFAQDSIKIMLKELHGIEV